ncbi:S-protein-like 29, partial [Mucuna pruriens]
MSLFAKNVFLLFVLMLVSVSNVFGSGLFPETHVTITNNLTGHLDLAFHCKSGDNDLGTQVLRYNETFLWKFRPNLLKTTLFFCAFKWKNSQQTGMKQYAKSGVVGKFSKLDQITMYLFANNVFFLFVLMLASMSNVFGSDFFAQTHVTITNNLTGHLDLTFHCKSGDDDLGAQVLRYNETFMWKFRPNLLKTTLFFCSFEWKNSPKVWFDIYKTNRDEAVCEEWCCWKIQQTGPCMTFLDNHHDCYKWNKH